MNKLQDNSVQSDASNGNDCKAVLTKDDQFSLKDLSLKIDMSNVKNRANGVPSIVATKKSSFTITPKKTSVSNMGIDNVYAYYVNQPKANRISLIASINNNKYFIKWLEIQADENPYDPKKWGVFKGSIQLQKVDPDETSPICKIFIKQKVK
tara:strand:+ start:333 stop:788 length:456 start_codon:yes stop_codon:yes gene_type:complete